MRFGIDEEAVREIVFRIERSTVSTIVLTLACYSGKKGCKQRQQMGRSSLHVGREIEGR